MQLFVSDIEKIICGNVNLQYLTWAHSFFNVDLQSTETSRIVELLRWSRSRKEPILDEPGSYLYS
jgi:hypothetical protein